MTRPPGADRPDRSGRAAALRALMLAGDAEALDRLARDYGPRLLAVARRCCRCRDDAEDAVQQALVSATTSRQGYRGDGHPVAWLSTLVARSCFRMNREVHNDPSRTVHHEHDEDDGHGSRVRAPCGGGDPEERAAQRQLEERLGEALMALSRTDRLAFLLAAEGHTSEEIAAEFHLTSDAVRGRLKRARKILREHLAPFVEPRPVTHPGAPAAPPGNTGSSGRRPTSPEDHPWPARSPP